MLPITQCIAGRDAAIASIHFSSGDPSATIVPTKEEQVDTLVTPEFWSALAAIVVIDLVLAGDSAIVIALADRSLPWAYQRRAIIWETLGAVAVRASVTVAVVWLLELPGLMLAGGALLAWIAYRLLTDSDGARDPAVVPASGFWGAMRTIVVADAGMGMDNVLGVAGGAPGRTLPGGVGVGVSTPRRGYAAA